MEFLAAYCHIYRISWSHKKLKSDSGFNRTQCKNENDYLGLLRWRPRAGRQLFYESLLPDRFVVSLVFK